MIEGRCYPLGDGIPIWRKRGGGGPYRDKPRRGQLHLCGRSSRSCQFQHRLTGVNEVNMRRQTQPTKLIVNFTPTGAIPTKAMTPSSLRDQLDLEPGQGHYGRKTTE